MFPETIAIFKKRNRQCAKNQGKEPAHRHFPYLVRLLNWLGNLFWCEFLLYRFWCLAQRHQPEHLADVSKYIQWIWSIARYSSGLKFSVFSSLTVNCKTFFGFFPHSSDTLKTREWRNDGYCDAFIGEGTESAGFLYFASEWWVCRYCYWFFRRLSIFESSQVDLLETCLQLLFLSFDLSLFHRISPPCVCTHKRIVNSNEKKPPKYRKCFRFRFHTMKPKHPNKKKTRFVQIFGKGIEEKRRTDGVYTDG